MFPPHDSHSLQSLDVSDKHSLMDHCETGSVPGLNVTQGKLDLPEIIKLGFFHPVTPSNITSGFMATGISPFNPDISTDDFAAAFVTDRPGPNTS